MAYSASQSDASPTRQSQREEVGHVTKGGPADLKTSQSM